VSENGNRIGFEILEPRLVARFVSLLGAAGRAADVPPSWKAAEGTLKEYRIVHCWARYGEAATAVREIQLKTVSILKTVRMRHKLLLNNMPLVQDGKSLLAYSPSETMSHLQCFPHARRLRLFWGSIRPQRNLPDIPDWLVIAPKAVGIRPDLQGEDAFYSSRALRPRSPQQDGRATCQYYMFVVWADSLLEVDDVSSSPCKSVEQLNR
jgi:hypothetical protein